MSEIPKPQPHPHCSCPRKSHGWDPVPPLLQIDSSAGQGVGSRRKQSVPGVVQSAQPRRAAWLACLETRRPASAHCRMPRRRHHVNDGCCRPRRARRWLDHHTTAGGQWSGCDYGGAQHCSSSYPRQAAASPRRCGAQKLAHARRPRCGMDARAWGAVGHPLGMPCWLVPNHAGHGATPRRTACLRELRGTTW